MKYNSLLKIAFCSALLLLMAILLDKLLDSGIVVFNNVPDFTITALLFFNKNSVEIAVVFLLNMVFFAIGGIIQFICQCGKGEAV